MLLRTGGLDVVTHSPNARVSLDKAPGGVGVGLFLKPAASWTACLACLAPGVRAG